MTGQWRGALPDRGGAWETEWQGDSRLTAQEAATMFAKYASTYRDWRPPTSYGFAVYVRRDTLSAPWLMYHVAVEMVPEFHARYIGELEE